jgi:hypothetical protein
MEICFCLEGLSAKLTRESDSWTAASMEQAFHTQALRPQSKKNKLLMHYGCQTAFGTELQTSLELLMAELGLAFQPFWVSFNHYNAWVTMSWLKRVWEKLDHFGFVLLVHNLLSSFPQEGGDWLMARFIAAGYISGKLLILNRVQKHQQVAFCVVVRLTNDT